MEELTTREGTVQSVIFQNEENGYTVLRLVTEEGELITVVGCIPCAAPGEHLGVSGTWETHPQHGAQLRAEEVERRLPEDAEETARVFDLLLGDNLSGRKDYIAENGYKYLDMIDVS